MSDEGEKTCPLCAEEMDLTDQQLKPCKCGYEICVWCWHHIMEMAEKDDAEGRCPACRVPYDKEKIVGMAASCERLVAEVSMERKKSQKAKTKPSEGRKQLSSVRVIQRNLVYVVGLPLNLADEDLLQRKEYFAQYGKVLKVSMSRTAAGVIQQFPNNTCSVYITYSKEEEAIRCIQSVHGFVLDGRSLKACFGTTKYCHAWLRNVPCTNPDCLYLHEIGSQEDSFTKDEIISAYTRSRVQQITGATNNLLRQSRSMLPPPVDHYCMNGSASAAKPIVKNVSNNTTNTGKDSPPNGSSARSVALPAAASWGMRASNQPQAVISTCSNGPTKPKPDTSTFQGSDVGKKATWVDEGQIVNGKGKLDSLKPMKQNVVVDCRSPASEKPPINDATANVTSSNPSSGSVAYKSNNSGSNVPNHTDAFIQTGQSCCLDKEGIAANDGMVENLCSDMSSMRVDGNTRGELSGAIRPSSSLPDSSVIKLPGNQALLRSFAEQNRESLSSLAAEKTDALVNVIGTVNENFDWRTHPQVQSVTNTVSELEEDIISFDNQRLKDPEVVSHTACLPNSANSLHVSNHSRSHSLQHNEAFGAINSNIDPQLVDNRAGNYENLVLHASSNFVISNGYPVISNGYPEKLISSSIGSDRDIGRSFLLANEGEAKHTGSDADINVALDVGESSIISNILSLELDAWDDSLSSPQNLAKLLGDADKQPSSLKLSSSWKVQNNNESRFSFARQEEARNQAFDHDPSFSIFGQSQKNRSFNQDFGENRNYLDKLGIGNGFPSCNFEESGTFAINSSVPSSNRPSVSRAQISAPPGFSVPNRPPPGFSSHERMDQTFDNLSGNHLLESSSLLRNSYQAVPTGNIVYNGDIEFMDPAILAVGKGRLQGGLNNPVLDMRSNFPQQLSAFENEARIQLLMQRSLSPHQNLRYADVGDSFSSLSDSYGISSRIGDQSQVSNLSPFAQLSLQQSRNGLMSNGRWDGWNEVQGGNSLGMAELLRNERLGFNKFYASSYEDSKFRMPSSGDLYNRTFEM